MKKQKVNKISTLLGFTKALVVAAVMTAFPAASILMPTSVLAWGPERPLYTNEKPADHVTFNSIWNNAAVQDERDFVRMVELKADNSGVYSSNLTVEAGKQYRVWIYYHNDASATYNDKDHDYAGVAADVHVASVFPTKLAAGEKGTVSGVVSWTTLADRKTVQKVWDEAYITAKEEVTLHYITASAKLYNLGKANGATLSTALFSGEGTMIGYNSLDGVILGCDQYSGQVVYDIAVEKPTAEPEPEPTPEEKFPDDKPKDEPETPVTPSTPSTPSTPVPTTPEPEPTKPEELPTTGPAEVIMAGVLFAVVIGGIAYYLHTHQEVKKTTRKAKGKR